MAYVLALTEAVVILVDEHGAVTTGGGGGTGTFDYEVSYSLSYSLPFTLYDPVTRLNHWYWWVWEGQDHAIAGQSLGYSPKTYSASMKLVYTWTGAPDSAPATNIDTTTVTLPVDNAYGWQFGEEGDNVGAHTSGGKLTGLKPCTWYWYKSLDPSHVYQGDEDDATPQPIVFYIGPSAVRQDHGSTNLLEWISCEPPTLDDYSVTDWKYIDFPDCGALANSLGEAAKAGVTVEMNGAWGAGSSVRAGLAYASARIGIKHGLQNTGSIWDGWIQPDSTMWYKSVQGAASGYAGAFRFVVPTESQIIAGWGGVLPSSSHKYWFKTICEAVPEDRGIYGLPIKCEDIAGQNKQLMVD
ncbi:MAG: hypothetical protein NT022_08785 [Deltaproteobacteria bacterium]|nr:hypothetical protein [Deltaproteobacteria bacterium]